MLSLSKTPRAETKAGRSKLAKAKQALSDGSFPIPNVAYLKKAIQAVGRAAPGKRPALAKLIRKRGRELGAMNVVKGSWADNTQSPVAMSNALRRTLELSTDWDAKRIQHEVVLTREAFAVHEFAGMSGGDSSDDVTKDPLYQKVYKAMCAKGMPTARAATFAKNAVNLRNRKSKATAGKA